MFVWIPRYAYCITSGYHTNLSGIIDIKFLKGTTNEATDGTTTWNNSSGQGNWNIHPAFQDGSSTIFTNGEWDKEIAGIWVAKFEASSYDSSGHVETSASSIGDVTTLTVKSLPNVSSWRNITIGNMYTNCINMISSLNSHMMKNSEWGAIAYLAQSIYGKSGTEVAINDNSSYLTGGGDYEINVSQSTTGNIYGIYDTNGGAWDYTTSYVANANANLANGSSYASTSASPASTKYVTVYKMGSTDSLSNNYNANMSIYGDAVYETSSTGSSASSWFSDSSQFPNTTNPFFRRGGYYVNGINAGSFSFHNDKGIAYGTLGFRPVLIVE